MQQFQGKVFRRGETSFLQGWHGWVMQRGLTFLFYFSFFPVFWVVEVHCPLTAPWQLSFARIHKHSGHFLCVTLLKRGCTLWWSCLQESWRACMALGCGDATPDGFFFPWQDKTILSMILWIVSLPALDPLRRPWLVSCMITMGTNYAGS